MNLRAIPRAAVGGYLKVLRVPLSGVLRLLGRGGDTTLDRVDATVRDAAGTATGDDALRDEAARRRTAADERDRAAELRAAAAATKQEADEQLQRQSAAADAQRRQAADEAAKRKAAAEKRRAARQRKAAEAERQRKEVSDEAAKRSEEAIEDRAQRQRLEQLNREAQILDQKAAALAASDEAQRLRDTAGEIKAERKSDD